VTSDIDMRIKQILTRRLGVPAAEISTEASLVDDFGLDSVDMVELTIALEQELGITIEDDDFREARSIRDVVEIVEHLMTSRTPREGDDRRAGAGAIGGRPRNRA
jgi:acyl carrier protein